MSVVKISLRAVRIKLQGSFVLIFGSTPVPIAPIDGDTKSRMSFGKGIVKIDCLLRRQLGFRKKLGWRQIAGDGERPICLRESGVSERIVRINFNRLLKI